MRQFCVVARNLSSLLVVVEDVAVISQKATDLMPMLKKMEWLHLVNTQRRVAKTDKVAATTHPTPIGWRWSEIVFCWSIWLLWETEHNHFLKEEQWDKHAR